jgi:hypothetical protein
MTILHPKIYRIDKQENQRKKSTFKAFGTPGEAGNGSDVD